ncbi:phosphoketolase family protein [Saccharopolyspora halophila]|uniref:Phosphoketolase family protein n=1 Tax=Saccharopolyspora halophila TaxID=405551 RepID=A0ABP5T6T4_9PSEU
MTALGAQRAEELARYRRACDYIAAAMIYLRSNVLLDRPLRSEDVKPRVLGHWGTCPGITLVYSGLNRLVRDTGRRTLLVTGPGHGAPAVHANLWLEGTHAEHDPELSVDGHGLRELIQRFSWPGGFPSHLSPEVPGVVHEGGELGYALATAVGAALDKPDLLVACIVGDGEAETGPTAGSWQSAKFLDPKTSGAVLPILHLNRYKISSPTVFASMSDRELVEYFGGCGWSPRIVDVTGRQVEADAVLAEALDRAHSDIAEIQREADRSRDAAWPMIVLRSPKGLGLPETDLDGAPLEGSFHAHQVPIDDVHDDPEALRLLESWLSSYRPRELFDAHGTPNDDLLSVPPSNSLRIGMTAESNGGRLRTELPLPDVGRFAVDVPAPGGAQAGATPTLGPWLTRILRDTADRRDFRIFCPDELESNKLDAALEATDRCFTREVAGYDRPLSPDGRVMEVLSEHLCQGWIEGYLLTGGHGLFPCYEAFASIIDSMLNQYAKFLKMSGEVPWREPVSSLNYLLTSEGWRQEHNGYSHQGPGFINNVLTKKTSGGRVLLPPDANTLLVTMRECLSSVDRINLVVAGKHDAPQWLDLPAAEEHCRNGLGTWPWASSDGGGEPDVVLACAGNIPTIETLAAVQLLRRALPELRVRVVNIVDLLALATPQAHPNGAGDEVFAECFGGAGTPVVFAFHGYPSAVHELLHGRPEPNRFHLHGYREEGTTTTPYCLLASNTMTRHDLAADAARRSRLPHREEVARELLRERDELVEHAHRNGTDAPAIREWRWT